MHLLHKWRQSQSIWSRAPRLCSDSVVPRLRIFQIYADRVTSFSNLPVAMILKVKADAPFAIRGSWEWFVWIDSIVSTDGFEPAFLSNRYVQRFHGRGLGSLALKTVYLSSSRDGWCRWKGVSDTSFYRSLWIGSFWFLNYWNCCATSWVPSIIFENSPDDGSIRGWYAAYPELGMSCSVRDAARLLILNA